MFHSVTFHSNIFLAVALLSLTLANILWQIAMPPDVYSLLALLEEKVHSFS